MSGASNSSRWLLEFLVGAGVKGTALGLRGGENFRWLEGGLVGSFDVDSVRLREWLVWSES